MSLSFRDTTAIVGVGASRFGRRAEESTLAMGATALRNALDDA